MIKQFRTQLRLILLVPLIFMAGRSASSVEQTSTQPWQDRHQLPELIYDAGENFSSIDSANLDGLLDRIGDSRLVLLGEASHGTKEFYEMRTHITRELIQKKGFTIVAVEADWPDATRVDSYIRGSGNDPVIKSSAFGGFPYWMWANNHSVLDFVHWLKQYNQSVTSSKHDVRFYGLLLNLTHRRQLWEIPCFRMFRYFPT